MVKCGTNRDSNPMLTGIGGFRIDGDTAD